MASNQETINNNSCVGGVRVTRLACHQTRSYRLGLMYMSPMSIAPARLGCLHIIHTSCLVTHIKSYPPHTAPAGYVCPTCSTSIWPPKSVKDSGSRLHSLLKEAIIQTGMEKNVFGNNPVSMSSPPEHLVTKDSVGGNGSAKPSSIDIVEIDAPNSANHIRSPPSGVVKIICISSDSSQAMSCTPPRYAIETSSDSSDSNGWMSYFPKIDSPKPLKLSSKRAESSSNLTKKDIEKMAFSARNQVVGLAAPKKWEDFGIKPWEPKLPKDPKGKGKKMMG
ncbi:RING/U-box superfamily protein [Artemisia annua]|uniref:RING/U-box superfamily protein n=1 Tax=Artemisia annua TaxID=35608 RepID=A0A2U1PS38_ARTAN|nr:RING/U-box superfamily protein [Artemisia annua]